MKERTISSALFCSRTSILSYMKRTGNTKEKRKRRMPPSGSGDQKDKLKSIKTTGKQKILIFVVFLTALITTFLGSALNLSVPVMNLDAARRMRDGW